MQSPVCVPQLHLTALYWCIKYILIFCESKSYIYKLVYDLIYITCTEHIVVARVQRNQTGCAVQGHCHVRKRVISN